MHEEDIRNMIDMIDNSLNGEPVVAIHVNHKSVSWNDARAILNVDFDNNYRAPRFNFMIWTATRIIFPNEYDGCITIDYLWINPNDALSA